MNKSKIVPIPEKMEKYYGKGNILHPSQEDVSRYISEIPYGEVMNIKQLCEKLANEYGTQVTCPLRTGNFIKKLAKAGNEEVPFWRVVRSDGLLVKMENLEHWAVKLEDEGIELTLTSKGKIKVK